MRKVADHQSRILVDVDGTITRGPGKTPYDFAPLNDGVRAFLGGLKDRGYEIVVFSARTPVDAVKKFFGDNDLARFVDGFTRVKLPAKLIVDDRVASFRGDYESTLRQIDNFIPWWDKPSEYSCVMAMLPVDTAAKITALGQQIKDEDLAENGREPLPHITILYGVDDDHSSNVRAALSNKKPAHATYGKLAVFETSDADVLHVTVDSLDLAEMNAAIRKITPHVNLHPEYRPHATVAYLKKGMGNKYLSLPVEGIDGVNDVLDQITFSNRTNTRQQIILK